MRDAQLVGPCSWPTKHKPVKHLGCMWVGNSGSLTQIVRVSFPWSRVKTARLLGKRAHGVTWGSTITPHHSRQTLSMVLDKLDSGPLKPEGYRSYQEKLLVL